MEANDSTLTITAGGLLFLDGGIDVVGGHAVLTGNRIVLGSAADIGVSGAGSYTVLEAASTFANQGTATAIHSSNGGVYIITAPDPASVTLNGLNPAAIKGSFSPTSLPGTDTIYYQTMADVGTGAGTGTILGPPIIAATNALVQPLPSDPGIPLQEDNSGNPTWDTIVDGREESSLGDKGDGDHHGRRNSILLAANGGHSGVPANEQVVGPGTIGTIGASTHVDVPVLPVLNGALTPTVRGQLFQALQP
jgi:hypothetical protein